MSIASKCFILFVYVCARAHVCVCVCTSVWKAEDNAGEPVFSFYLALRKGLLCFCLTENSRWAGPQASRQINLSPSVTEGMHRVWMHMAASGVLCVSWGLNSGHHACMTSAFTLWVWTRALWSPLQSSTDLEEDVRLVRCNSSSTSCCQNTSPNQFYLKRNAPALCDLGRSSLLFSVLTNAPSG